ncbi:MAG: division/cell wall cluster transcriptional repressor MraZ [bacterium]|nr:division/cell wall cluster transcriptional repressor MraZ [bacterium]
MYIGEYRHTIDEKRRLSIPSKFRKELGKGAVITRELDNCLVIFPMRVWEERAKKIGTLSESQKEARGFGRIKLAGANLVEFDKLGRILVPVHLAEYAGLEKDVVVAGIYNRLEVWDAEKWNRYQKEMEQNMESMAEKLGEQI